VIVFRIAGAPGRILHTYNCRRTGPSIIAPMNDSVQVVRLGDRPEDAADFANGGGLVRGRHPGSGDGAGR